MRLPDPAELAQLHAVPAALLPSFDAPGCSKVLQLFAVQTCCHAPSLAMVLAILQQQQQQLTDVRKVPRPWYVQDERHLLQLTHTSVFNPTVLAGVPGLFSAEQVTELFYARCALHNIAFRMPQYQLEQALSSIDLPALQVYWADTQLRGLQANPQGIEWAQQRSPALALVATGQQKGSGVSAFALPPLHEKGLSKSEHLIESAQVTSPFSAPAPLHSLLICL